MFARTERLTLRPVWPEDAPALMAIGHEPLARLLARDLPPADGADARAITRVPHEPHFVIEAHGADRPALVGAIRLSDEPSGADLAFWLTPPARGRGYATEAARAVVDIARHALPLARLSARHRMRDTASARVLTKLGFRATGHEAVTGSSVSGEGMELLYDLDVARPAPSA